jgi:hypothetical protein
MLNPGTTKASTQLNSESINSTNANAAKSQLLSHYSAQLTAENLKTNLIGNASGNMSITDKVSSVNTNIPNVPNIPMSSQYASGMAQSSILPPPSMAPYIDPSYMYYQMAATNPYIAGFPMNNPFSTYQMSAALAAYPFMNPTAASVPHMTDDQQSLRSFHFDSDNRSERKLSLHNRPQSVTGANYEAKPQMRQLINNKLLDREPSAVNNSGTNGLLMQETSNQTQNLNDTNSLINSATAQLKKDGQNRLTPQLHQAPHVKAIFSLTGLIKIRANDPCEGQPALVDIINLGDLMEQYLNELKKIHLNDNKESVSNNINFTRESSLYAFGATNEATEIQNEYGLYSYSVEMRNEILNNYKLLQEFPGPLTKENTSKAQVIQFCQKCVKDSLASSSINLIDPQSHALLWEYLSLLVRQNGIFDIKTDISPLLLNGLSDQEQQFQQTNVEQSLGAAGGLEQQPLQESNYANTRLNSAETNKSNQQLAHSLSSSSLLAMQQQDFVLVGNNEGSFVPTNSNLVSNSNSIVKDSLNDLSNKTSSSLKQNINSSYNEELTHLNKLRQLLGAGQRSEAIDLAIKHNMWPHALFLASAYTSSSVNSHNSTSGANSTSSNTRLANESKMLNKVKLRFINSLLPTDPIYTCYQLLIGRVPNITSNMSKLEWNDWRRHLAIIMANIDETNYGLVLESIKTMGDCLASSGRVAASHFCYLLSNCAFGTFNKKPSKLVLIGSSHNQEFNKFCQINAIQATEIYEYAYSLSLYNANIASSSRNSISSQFKNNFGDNFLKYKLIYANRLLEHGLINEASKYMEVIGKAINKNPKANVDKIDSVFQLANRLKVYDPEFSMDDLENINSEPEWLKDLRNNYKRLHFGSSSSNIDFSVSNEKKQGNIAVSTKEEPKSSQPSPTNDQQQQNEYTVDVVNHNLNKLDINSSQQFQHDEPININSYQYSSSKIEANDNYPQTEQHYVSNYESDQNVQLGYQQHSNVHQHQTQLSHPNYLENVHNPSNLHSDQTSYSHKAQTNENQSQNLSLQASYLNLVTVPPSQATSSHSQSYQEKKSYDLSHAQTISGQNYSGGSSNLVFFNPNNIPQHKSKELEITRKASISQQMQDDQTSRSTRSRQSSTSTNYNDNLGQNANSLNFKPFTQYQLQQSNLISNPQTHLSVAVPPTQQLVQQKPFADISQRELKKEISIEPKENKRNFNNMIDEEESDMDDHNFRKQQIDDSNRQNKSSEMKNDEKNQHKQVISPNYMTEN